MINFLATAAYTVFICLLGISFALLMLADSLVNFFDMVTMLIGVVK